MATSEQTEESIERPRRGQFLWEQFSTLVFAVIIALAVRACVIEPFRIPSGSMLPTLLIGDHLFVNKFIYGVRVPFMEIRSPGLRRPNRGDIVVFSVARSNERGVSSIVPADKRPDLPRDDFVKRIVGLPGDRVEVRGRQVFVNGGRVDVVDTGDTHVDEYGRRLVVRSERLEGCEHSVLDDPRQPGLERAPFTVSEDRYFMMGDNRDHSNDSRNWGTVHFDDFKGPAFILYWSWNVKGNFLEFLNPVNWWTAEKRWNRIFKLVRCESPATREANAPSTASAGSRQPSATATSDSGV